MFRATDHQQESIANRLGTANFQQGFDDYESLVFAVGDSYTQGTGLPADVSYPAQLDLILNRDEDGFYVKKFGVVNLGVAGFGGEQSLINLRRHGSRLRPPSVILYLGCDNDFEDDLVFRSGDRHRIVIAGSPFWGSLTRPLRLVFERTQVGLLARAAYSNRVRQRMVNEATAGLGRKPSVAGLEASTLERLKAYADGFAYMEGVLVLARLTSRWKLALTTPARVELSATHFLHPKGPLTMTLEACAA